MSIPQDCEHCLHWHQTAEAALVGECHVASYAVATVLRDASGQSPVRITPRTWFDHRCRKFERRRPVRDEYWWPGRAFHPTPPVLVPIGQIQHGPDSAPYELVEKMLRNPECAETRWQVEKGNEAGYVEWIERLLASVKELGFLHPLCVRRVDGGQPYKMWIAGNNRLIIGRVLGYTEMEVSVYV